MEKRKRVPKNIVRQILINLLKIVTFLAVTPPICFVLTILVLDFNPLTNRLAAYARMSQLPEWELPPQSTLLTYETIEKTGDNTCWLEGTLTISSHLSQADFETYYEQQYFEKFKYSYREFTIEPTTYYANGETLYHLTATRYWRC